jgi:hypothetical protein
MALSLLSAPEKNDSYTHEKIDRKGTFDNLTTP